MRCTCRYHSSLSRVLEIMHSLVLMWKRELDMKAQRRCYIPFFSANAVVLITLYMYMLLVGLLGILF